MVITEHNVGIIRINAVTSYGIVSTDDIIALAIDQRRIEAIYIVQLRRLVRIIVLACSIRFVSNPLTFIILYLIALDCIANAGDLGHIGLVNSVAAAHDHDLAAAVGNSFLRILNYCCHIIFLNISFNFRQIYFRSINVAVRIGNNVTGPIDNCSIRILSYVGLSNDAVGYTTDCLRSISILIDVERTIRQCRCTTKVIARYIPIIDDTGIGAGYGGSNAACIGIETGSHTAHLFSTVIALITIVRAIQG